MDGIDLERLQQLFDELCELQADARASRLEGIAAQAPALARQLRALLDADARAQPLLDAPLFEFANQRCSAGGLDAESRVGPWRLIRPLGHGGMGEVWLAERVDGGFTQRAALKLIRPDFDSVFVREHFRRERQILASLDHADIARLLDGGIHEDHTPWYAMQFIEGMPLDRYCERRGLPTRERLRLLAVICRAVHYAHTRLVVHRDLKPANILVDEHGRPHLLDFGIARLLDAEPGAVGINTQMLMGAATPAYAAPEQLRGEAVGTAADIYALGVIGFELVSGTRPQLPVAMPSTAGERGPLASQALSTERKRRSALRGDVDAILAQALAPDPGDRYASAEAFADDIESQIGGLPVKARGAGAAYRARLFIRRHAWGVAAAVLLVLALTTGLGSTLWQARQARAQAARAAAVKDFLTGLFEASDPDHRRGRTLTARELLDAGRRRIAAGDYSSAQLADDMRGVIGNLYVSLGLYAQAEPLLRKRLADTRTDYGAEDQRTLAAALDLAVLDYQREHYDDAARRMQDIVDHLESAEGTARPLYVQALSKLAATRTAQARYADAQRLFQKADRVAVRIFGERSHRRARLLLGWTMLDDATGHDARGLARLRRAIAIIDADHDTPRSLRLRVLWEQAILLRGLQRMDEAIGVFRRVLPMARQLYGDSALDVASLEADLADALRAQDHLQQAVPLLRDAIRIYQVAGAGLKESLATAWFDLGRALVALGKFDAADDALQKSEALYRQGLGADHPYVAMALMLRAGVALERRHPYDAEALARQAVAGYEQALPAGNPLIANARLELVKALLAEGRAAAAEAPARRIVANFRLHLGERDPRTDQARITLAEVLIAEHKSHEARQPLVQVIADYGERDPQDKNARHARKLLQSLGPPKG